MCYFFTKCPQFMSASNAAGFCMSALYLYRLLRSVYTQYLLTSFAQYSSGFNIPANILSWCLWAMLLYSHLSPLLAVPSDNYNSYNHDICIYTITGLNQ